jgi:acetyl-CoA carboxylase/biotin carboxylase 1
MRTIQETWPADPGNPDSSEQLLTSAPQVWMPESAFKTSQAIRDFNNGEHLPLMIFANWRGFSGGQNDLLKGILKFGSYIVDALVDYQQPVFVYVMGELRGGAWVVLDPTINPDFMEMYAETNARGGVLEPEGTVEIKYRKNQIQATIERLDDEYKSLKVAEKELSSKSASSPMEQANGVSEKEADAQRSKEILSKISAREKKLIPVYHQVALHFADLHDTPKRMLAKGVIRGIVDWHDSRRLFYWRLKRRLLVESLVKDIAKARPDMDRAAALDELSKWYAASSGRRHSIDGGVGAAGMDDVADADAVSWLEAFKGGKQEELMQALKKEGLKAEVRELLKKDRSALLEGITGLMRHLTAEEKEQLLQVGSWIGSCGDLGLFSDVLFFYRSLSTRRGKKPAGRM